MEAFEGCVEPFVVAGESSEACGPSEASFHDPAAGLAPRRALGAKRVLKLG